MAKVAPTPSKQVIRRPKQNTRGKLTNAKTTFGVVVDSPTVLLSGTATMQPKSMPNDAMLTET
jgi:hypothetical protein